MFNVYVKKDFLSTFFELPFQAKCIEIVGEKTCFIDSYGNKQSIPTRKIIAFRTFDNGDMYILLNKSRGFTLDSNRKNTLLSLLKNMNLFEITDYMLNLEADLINIDNEKIDIKRCKDISATLDIVKEYMEIYK